MHEFIDVRLLDQCRASYPGVQHMWQIGFWDISFQSSCVKPNLALIRTFQLYP